MERPSSAETFLPREAGQRTRVTGLPPDLIAQSARRLRIQALMYAFVFFMSDPLSAILFPEDRARFLASPLGWAPAALSITVALVVAAVTLNRRIAGTRIVAIGLAFEVAGSFGIAAAQYLDPVRYPSESWEGLSWVAVWMVSFSVVVPSPPRWALAASLASASAVPMVVGLTMATGLTTVEIPPSLFLFRIVLPYLLVVAIAHVGARVIYNLGAELHRARELGSYRLVEPLGQGGMGEVWRARHRLLARPAAIKLIRPEMLGGSPAERDSLHARFEREAQATAAMRSPHTIEVYDFGVADDGTFFYVMELLDGFDLGTLVERFGPIPQERAVHLLRQVCHSLGEAHAAGLIHRDIKPANVYVCRYGREMDFVKVLDFGLVKSQRDTERGVVTLTRAQGAIGGTPAFMSPEQVLANRPVDVRSDIYAVGCLAYWLVTGQLVFTGRTVIDTLLQHTQAPPVPPSQRTELEISPAFDRLVLSCLAKNPQDRPPTADALGDCLGEVRTTNPWTTKHMRQWWETHHPPSRVSP